MLSGTRLLNLNAVMKLGIGNHCKWSHEYMVTNHKRHFSLSKSRSGVDNVHHVPISSRHCTPAVVQPKWSTPLCFINVPSYRCISTTGMFFYTPPDPSNGYNLFSNGNSSNSQSNVPVNHHSQLNNPLSYPFTQQSNSWQWWYKFIGASAVITLGTWIGLSLAAWLKEWWIGLSVAAWLKEWWKVAKVDKAILKGTSPNPLPINSPVDRQEIIDEVVSRFINKKDANNGAASFGVISGPARTGKTHVVTQACHQHPEGVLYCDIMTSGDTAKCLAEVAGMRTEPNLLGKLAGHFFGSPIGYYKLPGNDLLATTYIVKEIAKRSEKLKKRLGRPACLFIDGVDVIAKHDKDLFIQLIDLAKKTANKGSLRMIFVSSEGHVIPLLKETSSQSRWDIMEIVDITEDQAVDYLCGQGLSNELAEGIVKAAGYGPLCQRLDIKFVLSELCQKLNKACNTKNA